jgi:hypothetical protein
MDVDDDITSVEVSASRKVQLDQYEPIETFVSLTAEKPADVEGEAFDDWLAALSERAMQEAERAAMERHEEYVREEAFGDD